MLLSLIFATIAYILMIITNTLANTLPINNINTGEVSYKYPNLFQPTGMTFSIWGIIYTLLIIYLISRFMSLGIDHSSDTNNLYIKINIIFGISSLLNIAWLFAWHYDKMILSTIIMIGLLVSLIVIAKWTIGEDLLTRASFSVYLAWISIATIANITILLVKLGVPNFTESAILTTSIMLIIGLVISSLWIIKESDYIYGVVIIWAYLGILIRHLSSSELNKAYPLIYLSTVFSIIVLISISLSIFIRNLN
jgi:hypothetical protein